MDNQYTQHLRYKLQKRFRRLNSASYMNYHWVMSRFWDFIQHNEIFVSLIEELLARHPNAETDAIAVTSCKDALFGETDDEAAAIGANVIRQCLEFEGDHSITINIAHNYCHEGEHNAALPHFTENIVEPLYEYLDEKLDDKGALLALLKKYKHRSEWFHREELSEAWSADTRRGEKLLALNLYEYLFDQGVDLYVEPTSASGEADMVSSQHGEERLVADAKIFSPEKSKSVSYIMKGIQQIYSYTVDFNEAVGYLVVFNVSSEILDFEFAGSSQSVPFVVVSGKTIFILTIDLHLHEVSASKRGKAKTHRITEEMIAESAVTDDNDV